MTHSWTMIKLFAVMLFCSLTALAQTSGNVKQFNKDGLTFDYPNGWVLNDTSNSDAQQLTIGREGSPAQIIIFVHRGLVDTPEKLAEARSKIIEPYLNATSKQFVDMGAKPSRTPASIQIGGAQAEGVRILAVLDTPGEAGVYWLTLGNRLVVLTLFGPDQELKKMAPVWETVRNSMRVADIKPAPKPAPK